MSNFIPATQTVTVTIDRTPEEQVEYERAFEQGRAEGMAYDEAARYAHGAVETFRYRGLLNSMH